MSKKKPKQKGSSSSKKTGPKTKEKVDLNEYEDSVDGEVEGDSPEIIKDEYDDYELPEDFVHPDKGEVDEKDQKWFKKRYKDLVDMEDSQRLYWIKILSGSVTGIIIGIAGASQVWWLLLMVGLYAVVTLAGFYMFKLEWGFKDIIFNGLFPYIALFTLFWVLMFSSIYAPTMTEWFNGAIKTVITANINGTEIIYTSTRTTSAAGFPFISTIIAVLSTFGLLQFFLRRQKRKELND